MSNNTPVIGVDLAKTVFQVVVLENGEVTTYPKMSRSRLKEFLATHRRGLVSMEACYSAHYWGRKCQDYGHQVRLIPPQHVKPFTRGNKTDANDALAIVEASQRPNLREVPVKSVYHQDIQNLHRIRERLVGNRTALINQTRGLLSEYGLVFARGKKGFVLGIESVLNSSDLSELMTQQLREVLDELSALNQRIRQIELRLQEVVKSNRQCRILSSIPGIGVINASALVCKYDGGNQFKNARAFAATLGLTPKLYASGAKQTMLGISKRGDPYLRKQLIQGAKSLLMICEKRPDDALCRWATRLKKRCGHNTAVVAVANRIVRLAWVLLRKGEYYRPMPV